MTRRVEKGREEKKKKESTTRDPWRIYHEKRRSNWNRERWKPIENEKSFQTRLKYIFKRELTWIRNASRENSTTENIYDADRPGKIPEGCWPPHHGRINAVCADSISTSGQE